MVIVHSSSAFCCAPILKLSPARQARRHACPTLVDFPHPARPTRNPGDCDPCAPLLQPLQRMGRMGLAAQLLLSKVISKIPGWHWAASATATALCLHSAVGRLCKAWKLDCTPLAFLHLICPSPIWNLESRASHWHPLSAGPTAATMQSPTQPYDHLPLRSLGRMSAASQR